MTREYLTPNDFEIAEQNGISKKNVVQRFNTYDWSIERCITEPTREINKNGLWEKYKDISVVSKSTFRKRIREEDMLPEVAATKPAIKNGQTKRRSKQHANNL